MKVKITVDLSDNTMTITGMHFGTTLTVVQHATIGKVVNAVVSGEVLAARSYAEYVENSLCGVVK